MDDLADSFKMYVPNAKGCQLSVEKKKQIRRNEQIQQEHYEAPNVFRLIKVGTIKTLEQGDTVLGKVKVVTTNKIACQVIYVEFKGMAVVDFNVPSTTMIDEIQNFRKEWEFFSHKIPVLMHETRGYNFLEPGIYEFYFKARVPIGGPCSFLTDIASVTYRFSGVLVRNDVTADVASDNYLTYHVCGNKDLNAYDGARVGFWQEKISNVGGFLGMFRGKVEIRIKTDKRAFIPNEKIYIIGEVVNTTWRRCTFRYELIQTVKMWGDHYFWRSDSWGSRHLMDELVMERGKERPIESGERITLKESLHIPKGIEPSYLGMSAKDYINDLINLQYSLRFEVDIPYSPNLRVTVPIIIGTEPFIYLPNAPGLSNSSSNDSLKIGKDGDNRLKTDIIDIDKDEPFQVPKFHPLNPSFQKKFPETFLTPSSVSTEKVNKMRKDRKKHKSKCRCTKKSHRKRHRSSCKKGHRKSDSSSETGSRRRSSSRGSRGSGSRRVTANYGGGIPLEECTYENWLAASVEDYDGTMGDGKGHDRLLDVMKQYGLLSQSQKKIAQ